MKKIKKIILSTTAKSTYLTSSADISLALLAALTTAIIARNLSTSDFGIFISLWTFLTLIASILDIGIGGGIINFISRTKNTQKQNQYIGSSLVFLFFIGISILSIILLTIQPLQKFIFPNITKNLIILASFGSTTLLLASYLNDVLRAKQLFIKSAISVSLFAFLRLTLIIYLLIISKFNLYYTILIMSFSPVIYLIIAFTLLAPPIKTIRWNWKPIKKILGFSGWLGINQIVTTLSSRIDVLLLNRLSNGANAGIYGTASLMSRIFLTFARSLLAVFAPRLVQIKSKYQQKQFLLKIFFLVFTTWISMLGIAFTAKPLIIFIFGTQYLPALKPFYLLLIAMAGLISYVPILLPIIYILKKPKIIANLSTLQFLIILLGNIVFIPKYGIIIPALLWAISQFIILIIATLYLRKWWTKL